jgi:hypothetical protein
MRALGIAREFWFWNYPFTYRLHLVSDVPGQFSALSAVRWDILADPALWLLGAWGAIGFARTLRLDRASGRNEAAEITLLVIVSGYSVFLARMRFPFEHYFIQLIPALAVFAARALDDLSPLVRERRLVRGVMMLMPSIIVGILMTYPSNRAQREIQRRLLRESAPDRPVFAPPPFNPIVRQDSAYFWFNATMFSRVYRETCANTGQCRDEKIALDESLFATSPWSCVWLTTPLEDSPNWTGRRALYDRTELPMLFVRRASPSPSGH